MMKFVEYWPDIIRAAQTPGGLVALLALIMALLAWVFFRQAPLWTRVLVFAVPVGLLIYAFQRLPQMPVRTGGVSQILADSETPITVKSSPLYMSLRGVLSTNEAKVKSSVEPGSYDRLRCRVESLAAGTAIVVTLGAGDCRRALTYEPSNPSVVIDAPSQPFVDSSRSLTVGTSSCLAYRLERRGTLVPTFLHCGIMWGTRSGDGTTTQRATITPVTQVVKTLGRGNTILLDYDPVPESLRINVNGIIYYPRNAFRLEKRSLRIVGPTMLKIVTESLPRDGTIVEYLRSEGAE